MDDFSALASPIAFLTGGDLLRLLPHYSSSGGIILTAALAWSLVLAFDGPVTDPPAALIKLRSG
jgi:hypothetical protein